MATVREAPAELPAAFAAPIPVLPGEWPESAPPRAWVEDGLCWGDASLRARFVTSLEKATEAAGPAEPGVSRAYYSLIHSCQSESMCEWAAGVIASQSSPAVQRPFYRLIPDCGPRHAALLARPDAPIEDVERMRRKAQAEALESAGEKPKKEVVALPADLVAAACNEEDLEPLGRAHPGKKGALAKALGQCLLSPATEQRLRSERRGWLFLAQRMQTLAELDFAEAHSIARKLRDVAASIHEAAAKRGAPEYADDAMARLAFLSHFERREVVVPGLRAMGFVVPAGGSSRVGESVPSSIVDALEGLGVATRFDPETGQWPNAHDHLARLVTRPIAADVEGVVFAESARDDGTYLLRAYFDGRVLETDAANQGDWYDLDAVVGWVNAVLARRGSKNRVALVSAGGNEAVIVAAPQEALRRAMDARLIRYVDGAAAVRDAKAYEAEALRGLR